MIKVKVELLQQLSEANAIAANEEEVRNLLRKELQTDADEILYDNLGSIIFKRNGHTNFNIMIAAHMDEVGWMVKSILPSGLLEVIAIGSVRMNARSHQAVMITTKQRQRIAGYLVSNRDDIGQSDQKMYVDIGVDKDREAIALGIQVGDMVTFDTGFKSYPNARYAGKALDDRVGCFIASEVFHKLAKEEVEANVYFAATSSEEVGMRGAKTATHKIQPDIAFVLDVACPKDILQESNRGIGKGPTLLHYDKTMVPNSSLLTYLKEIAKAYKLPYQADMFSGGGTDGGSIHIVNNGCICVVIGIPLRYGHAPLSIVDYKDIETSITLVYEAIKHLTPTKIERMLSFEDMYEF